MASKLSGPIKVKQAPVVKVGLLKSLLSSGIKKK